MGLARVRRTRIDQLVDEGNKAAKLVQVHLEDPDRFISACQLGITLATLALGAAGEASFADKLAALFAQWGAMAAWSPEILHFARLFCFGFSFVITAFCQTVFGELIPKTWTFQRAESVLFTLIYPMEWWCWIASPFIIVLNSTTEFILRRMNVVEPPRRHFVHSEEELKMLVSASHEEGVLEPEEEEMLHSVFDFSDTVASEIMTPRTDMTCVSANSTVRQFVDLALEKGHSRIPIYETDLDSIFGAVHIRDGLRAMVEKKEQSQVRELARKVLIVPENKNLGDLLTEFKKTKTHMAIVVDEYGGTRGMATFEDLLEELVGDIADEHEIVEEFIVEEPDGTLLLDAKLPLYEANDKLGLNIDDSEFNTLGGHVFGALGREPSPGDEVTTDAYTLRIEESDRHRIIKLRLIRHPKQTDGSNPNGNKIDLPSSKQSAAKSLEAS
jgi:CBS domain containing-hemolysin-like protein